MRYLIPDRGNKGKLIAYVVFNIFIVTLAGPHGQASQAGLGNGHHYLEQNSQHHQQSKAILIDDGLPCSPYFHYVSTFKPRDLSACTSGSPQVCDC